jgi:hypothetical protein
MTHRSKYSTAAFVTSIFIGFGMNGAGPCPPFILASPAMKSSAVLPRSVPPSKFKAGDLAGVGCMLDSDRTCPQCQAGLEQYCPNVIYTYNLPESTWAASPIPIQKINEAYERLLKSDVKYRFSIDMKSLKNE